MKQQRRDFLKLSAAASTAAVVAPRIARAADFPSEPVQLIVPFSPGGGADRTMRLFAPYLADELGVPVNVVNIEGGGGWVAWSELAKWDPEADAHKLCTVNLPHVFSYMDPRMQRSETLESFNFVAWHSYDPCIWAVRENDERFGTLKQFLAYVEEHPDEIIMSSTAVGSDDHMGIAFAEKFLPNFKVKKIYANGDNKKIQEVISGVSDCVAGNVGYYVPFMLDAQLRPICVLHPERWPEIPSVPTFEEVTGQRNISYAGRTLAAAPGLAEERKQIYVDAIRRAISNPDYVIKEINNKNHLMFLEGDAMWDRLNQSSELVAEVKFWEAES